VAIIYTLILILILLTMNKITLYQLLEIEVRANNALDPFSELFDRQNFTNIIDQVIQSKYKGEIEYNQEGQNLVSALLELNKIYEMQLGEIKEIFTQTGLSSLNLVERVIASTNFYYLTVLQEQRRQQQSDDKGKLEDLNIIAKGDFKNMNGAAVAATDVSDSVNDAASELITILLQLNLTDTGDKPIKEAKITEQLARAIQIASIMNGMRSNFLEFKFETASITYESDTITFKKTPGNYFIIKAANKMRQRNQVTEFFITGSKFPRKPLTKPDYKIDKGNIEFTRGNKKDDSGLDTFVLTDFLTFHFHLHLIKPGGFDEYKVNDIFKLFEYIRVFFFSIDPGPIIKNATASQNYHDIPYKVKVDHLTDFLIQESGFSSDFVHSFIDKISQPLRQQMDIWAKPLIRINNDFLVLLGTIGGDLTYQFEQMIDDYVTPADQLKHFKNILEIELDSLDHKHTLKKIDLQPVSDQVNTEGLLVYQTLNHLVVLKLILIKYPLDPEKTAFQMAAIFKESETFKDNLSIVEKNIKQLTGSDRMKITPLLITNHPLFSGMVIERFAVLDAILLKNYIDKGKYTRAIIIAAPGKIDSESLSSYPYYHDDASFDGNLLSFAYQPAPVYEMQKNMHVENFKLSPGDHTPLIFSQSAELQTLRESMSDLVTELETWLKQLYYFNTDYDKDPDGKRLISDRIDFLTPLTFSYFALDKTDRRSRMVLLSSFKKVGFDGMIHLVNNLLNASRQVARKGFTPKKEIEQPPIDHEKAELQWHKINEKLAVEGPVSPSTFKYEHDLSEEDRDNLIRHLFSLGAAFGPGIYTEEQINDFYILVTITTGLAAGLARFEKDIYTMFLNLMDLLNYNGHFQKARDFSEEALAYSFNYEKAPLLGWLVQFKCFSRQRSVHDAAFYGSAYFAVLNALPEITAYKAFDGFYNAMLFFRNFGFTDLADNFFKSLLSMPLESYQLQQVTLSFLNSKLQDIENLQQHLQLAEDFLNKHILEITQHGQQGAMPWTALIFNLLNIESKGYITVPASLKVYLKEFEKLIEQTTLDNLRGQFFPDEKTAANLLKDALIKTYQTRALEDYAAEITSLEMLANNVAGLSIVPLKLDDLLICGLVINDQTLTFQEKVLNEMQSFTEEKKTDVQLFENYSDILAKIPIQHGQVIIWLFEFNHHVCALFIDENQNTVLNELEGWSLKSLREWQSKLPDYYFDEKNGYPINQQEGDYIDDLRDLSFSRISLPFAFKELLVYFSLDIAAFPPNLLELPVAQLNENQIGNHEERVREYIKEQPFDFLGYHKPVTNIISLEYFAAKGVPIIANLAELNLACWIPTVDEDMVLYIAEKTLRPLLENKYKITIQNSIYPKPALDATINVFVAHGAKSITGFRSVHTRGQTEGHALINDTGIARVFGTGFIAVVFICDSGAMTKDIYNQKLISLVNEILSLGYKAVVAPTWKYNPAITSIWLEAFMDSLKAGGAISFAVQTANQRAAKEGFDEYFGFYSPRGWAAMHLYGNPNICFR